MVRPVSTDNLTINGSNHIDAKLLAVHLVKHLLAESDNRVVLALFDDTSGSMVNLMKHLMCRAEEFEKSGRLQFVVMPLLDRCVCSGKRLALYRSTLHRQAYVTLEERSSWRSRLKRRGSHSPREGLRLHRVKHRSKSGLH